MEDIIHPISGEKGFFISNIEKTVINIALLFVLANIDDVITPCSIECGVGNE